MAIESNKLQAANLPGKVIKQLEGAFRVDLSKSGIAKVEGKGRNKWVARTSYTDDDGRERQIRRFFPTMREAKEALPKLLNLADTGGQSVDPSRVTVAQLVRHFQEDYCGKAEYRGERKVAGLRSPDGPRRASKLFAERYGRRLINSITVGDLKRWKAERMAEPTRTGGDRSIASVNRDLSHVRRMFNIAEREGWVDVSPFRRGERLISLADEQARTRVVTLDEEERLLEQCVGRRAHLRPIIVAALDTGCRLGELLSLTWSDVDMEGGLIKIRAMNSKTARAREVMMTTRLHSELEQLCLGEERGRVFGPSNNIKSAWTSIRRAAGLKDVRLHDLRHTAATRLVACGIPLPEVGNLLGHTSPETTMRYVNATTDSLRRAADALTRFRDDALVASELVS